jgi:anti-sigma B factor antagonist
MAIQHAPRVGQSTGCLIDLLTDDDGLVVEVSGEVDLASSPYLRERLVEALRDYPPSVRIDLSQVGFFGSPGTGLLVMACKHVKRYGGSFSVTCGRTITRRAFEIEGLVDILNVSPE